VFFEKAGRVHGRLDRHIGRREMSASFTAEAIIMKHFTGRLSSRSTGSQSSGEG
jgi:hypothetical protein